MSKIGTENSFSAKNNNYFRLLFVGNLIIFSLFLLGGCRNSQGSNPCEISPESSGGYEIILLSNHSNWVAIPVAMNNSGQVVVQREGKSFLWGPEGEMYDLSMSGSERFSAVDINEKGQVVGSYVSDVTGRFGHAMLLNPDGNMVDLGTLGGTSSWAKFVNSHGQVIGISMLKGDSLYRPFLWTVSEGMKDLGNIYEGEWIYTVITINDQGTILGNYEIDNSFRAWIWTPQKGMQDLGSLGGEDTTATAMNNRGQIVGISKTPNDTNHAFLWTKTGGMQDLGTLGGESSHANDINEQGHVVGVSGTANKNWGFHAFLWTVDKGMQDLGSYQGNPSEALFINDRGLIIGQSERPNGQSVIWAFDQKMRKFADFGEVTEIIVKGVSNRGEVFGEVFGNDNIKNIYKIVPRPFRSGWFGRPIPSPQRPCN